MIAAVQITELERTLNKKLEHISTALRQGYMNEKNIGVIEGLSGIALFQFYYSKYKDDNTYANWGEETLFRIIELINEGYDNPIYSTGLAGAGWLFDHLVSENFIDIDNDELFGTIDPYIFEFMKKTLDENNFDFLHGGIGYAIYFLSRFQSTHDERLRTTYKSYLDLLLRKLEQKAIQDDNGIKWMSIIKSRTLRLEGYNLSHSHGMSSIIAFLCDLSTVSGFRNRCMPLIQASVTYLLSNEFPKTITSKSLFPCWTLDNGESDVDSRLAWCYGDFGIGLATLKASSILDNSQFKRKAIDILKHTTKRTEREDTKVIDAAICHGAFGNAQIYNSIYQRTGDITYKTSASFWIKYGLNLAIHKDGPAGFKQWYGNPEGWRTNMSLLEGISGIGLTIIDYLSAKPNNWDKCLLIK